MSDDGFSLACHEYSPLVNSMGIWDKSSSSSSSMAPSFLTYNFTLLNLQLVVLFCVAQATHFALKRFGVVEIASQMIAGIILGPLVLGRLNIVREVIFPHDKQRPLRTMAMMGYILYLFISGVKMDSNMVRKTGRKTMVLGLACCVPALVLCNAIDIYFKRNVPQQAEGEDNYYVIMLLTQSLRSFPVIASLLGELKILNSELGRLCLSAAVISELFTDASVIVYRVYLVYINKPQKTTQEACKYIGFLAFTVLIFRPAMFWIIKRTPQGRPVKDKYTNFIILFIVAFVVLCSQGLGSTITGCFLLGLAIPSGSPLGSALEKKFENLVVYFLVPLQATLATMKMDFQEFSFNSNAIKFGLAVIVLTTLLVLPLCYGIARYCKMPHADAISVALILSSKGIFELTSISTLRDEWSINGGIFDLFAMNILATAIIVPATVKYLYDPMRKYGGYQKRDIIHLKYNDEMKVVAIIHRPDNVNTSINLLDAFGPSVDGPININVLHLVEQVGRATPIFISHKIQTRTVSSYSYSGDVIKSFSQYQKSYQPGTVDVNVYTAVSPSRMMHEDVCNLALNKLANFIILPFHQKRSIDGVVESEYSSIRALNRTVLDKGPCSVGIFIDNGGFENRESGDIYNVGIVFIGGRDDREALSLAKWMVKDPRISLSLLHLIAADDDEDDDDRRTSKHWGKMLDNEVLKDFMMAMQNKDNANYGEKVVKDGPETAYAIQSMLEDNDFHLVLVGRHYDMEWTQTDGLGGEWSDYPELGALGDLLASYEINAKTSVLVVQQQRLAASKA